MVFQDPRLLPWRRVAANVRLGLEGLKLSRAEKAERAAEALRLARLEGFDGRWPHELSGGQRQRAGIARALAVAPDILLMDEPFGALDAITRRGLQDELRRIHAETGKTILFVTHDIDEAARLPTAFCCWAAPPPASVRMRPTTATPTTARRAPALRPVWPTATRFERKSHDQDHCA
mgnify:CR=1 FL=1